jgi:hypothetical protein
MKPEAHLEKAKRIEASLDRLNPEEDWEMVVEGAYAAALHRVAWICADRVNEHRDTHKGLVKFLMQHGLREAAVLFQQLDALRMGHWYGGRTDGGAADRALSWLERLREMTEGEQ